MIKSFEGLYLHPYLDPVGVPTIGWGSIRYPDGRKVMMTDRPITEIEAEAFLIHEIEEKSSAVRKFLQAESIRLGSNEFSALVSFAYNLGPGPVVTKGRSMNEALKSRDRLRIADAFLIYNKAGRMVNGRKVLRELAGLTRRRKAERALFLLDDDLR